MTQQTIEFIDQFLPFVIIIICLITSFICVWIRSKSTYKDELGKWPPYYPKNYRPRWWKNLY